MLRQHLLGKLFFCLTLCSSIPLSVASAQVVRQVEPPVEFNSKSSSPKEGSRFDSDDPPEATIEIAPNLFLGGQLSLEFEHERNYDLNAIDADDFSFLSPDLSLSLLATPSKKIEIFLSAFIAQDYTFLDGEKNSDRTILEIESLYLTLGTQEANSCQVQLGRQRFEDEREWLYDEELDGLRIYWFKEFLTLEASVSKKDLADRDLLRADLDQENINNFIFSAHP